MAPRGRPKKPPTGRMGYAYDQMRILGFEHDDIKRELMRLHKLYGDENWFFVEEDNCKVILEALLSPQEGDPPPAGANAQENLLEEAQVEENAVADPVVADSRPPNLCLQAASSSILGAASQPSDADSVVEDMEGGGTAPTPPSPPPMNSSDISSLSAALPRQPCYGWISDDSDDSEGDLVYLSPSRSRFTAANSASGNGEIENENEPKRKSRWDMAPVL